MNLDDFTIRQAQRMQPWTVPYSEGVQIAAEESVAHILGSHVALHLTKTVGKIGGVFEALDHRDSAITTLEVQTLADMAADLTTAALRLANLYEFDLAESLVRRVREKNNAPKYPSEF